jgi:hypothetical protein
MSILVSTTRFWSNHHQVRPKSKDWKAKYHANLYNFFFIDNVFREVVLLFSWALFSCIFMQFESCSENMYSIQQYVIKVCQWLAAGWWFSPGTPVSSTNKPDRYDIAELLLKVALDTITLTLYLCNINCMFLVNMMSGLNF